MVHWRKVEVKFYASTMVGTKHVIRKPSPGLGRLRVVGLASHTYMVPKVHMLKSNTTIIWTIVFEWYIVKCKFKKGHQKDMVMNHLYETTLLEGEKTTC